MYKLHCSKCDNVIESNESFFKLTYVEYGVGNWASSPRHCEVCSTCFTDFKRAIDWEIGRVCEVEPVKPPVVGSLPTLEECKNTCNEGIF